MNIQRTLFKVLIERKWQAIETFRKFHAFPNFRYRQMPSYTTNPCKSSLFLTTLPAKKREKKSKFKIKKMPTGPVIIACKNSDLNHHQGMVYGTFEAVPLASKGWHHKKSKGDYFTILRTFQHPAFISSRAAELPKTFKELGISDAVIEELLKMGVYNPTVIQAKSVEKLLKGENVMITAETGCGKTLAYVIPMMENILKFKSGAKWEANAPLGIILLPTKELTVQVGNVVSKLGAGLGLHCVTLISGDFDEIAKDPSVEITDVVVTTLGILMRYMRGQIFSTRMCRHLVIDEADIFFEEKFLPDLRRFISMANLNLIGLQNSEHWANPCQLCLTSATGIQFSAEAEKLIPVHNLETTSTGYLHKVMLHVRQHFMRMGKINKPETLLKIVRQNVKNKISTMIFSNKTATCTFVQCFLKENGVETIQINSEMFSDDRLKGFMDFKDGKVFVLSCTDCMSRGLNMPWVKQIINYDFPNNMASYIHRCGRTGRLGYDEDCAVINFVSAENEIKFVNEIERAARTGSELTRKFRKLVARAEDQRRKRKPRRRVR